MGQTFAAVTIDRKLLRRIDGHLQARQLGDPDAQRLLNELGRHHQRGNLFRFLTDPRVPPTNNLAERELRPEVIGRKVSGGSKNWNGARTRERLSTITRTVADKRARIEAAPARS